MGGTTAVGGPDVAALILFCRSQDIVATGVIPQIIKGRLAEYLRAAATASSGHGGISPLTAHSNAARHVCAFV